MVSSSSVIDWETLKPKIIGLLSAGKTRRNVIEEISKDGSHITKSQLEYQLKCWGRKTNLTEQAWRYANHKVQKRARNKKGSAVFFNGALIPHAKVIKETRRHDRPTLLPAPGGSPKCPEGYDLVICTPPSSANSPCNLQIMSPGAQHSSLNPRGTIASLPWLKSIRGLRKNFILTSRGSTKDIPGLAVANFPTPFQFPTFFTDFIRMHKPPSSLEKRERPYRALLGWSESNETDEWEAVTRRFPGESQSVDNLGFLIFQISNDLSTGSDYHDAMLFSNLSYRLKSLAMSSSSWKGLLTAGEGATSRSLIEQLFEFSIAGNDTTLTEMMLQIGADPNQQICNRGLGMRYSALEFAVKWQYHGIINMLLNSGAICSQVALMYAIVAGSFETADRMLQSDSSLDINFDYLGVLDSITISRLGHLKLESATLPGLVCIHTAVHRPCNCNKATLLATKNHVLGCPMNNVIASLIYLQGQEAEITLDTMILASFSVDVVTLQFLSNCGGNVRGFNRLGFSCLAAASLRMQLQYDVFEFLLCSGATVDIPETHHAFGVQGSPFHYICLRQQANRELETYQLYIILDLLVRSGGNINYRIRHQCSPSQLDEPRNSFLWSQPSQDLPTTDLIAQARAESPLEYAIIAGKEATAVELVTWGCQPTGREITLAVKFGLLWLLQTLLNHKSRQSDGESIRKTCLRLAVRWGHESIVRFLLREGVILDEQHIMYALQYPGLSNLSVKTQVDLISATPDLDEREFLGLTLLELCFLKLSKTAVREILVRFPAAYHSGALAASVLRTGKFDMLLYEFHGADVETLISRRTESNRDWEKENTALLVAAMFRRPEILRILVIPRTVCVIKTARLPKTVFSRILDPLDDTNPYAWIDVTQLVGCQDWVECSPLVGLATAPDLSVNSSVSEEMLENLLACCYEPDALTVVVAAAKGNLGFLRRLRCLHNWRSIVSIDSHDRPAWCPTALQAAASDENEELVEFFLGASVSVNEEPANEPMGNRMPRTALQAAIEKGNRKLTTLFIERGACINAPAAENSGATALQLACIHGSLDISRRLLELGADVNARGAQKNGRTALEGAAEHGRIDTIQLLLNHGAYTDGPHRAQYIKAVVHAEQNRHFAAAALLKEHREWTPEDEECYKSLQSYEWCDAKRE